MLEFCEVLQRLRRNKGLTRPELSKALGFGVNVIYTYESGKVQPTLPRLCAIADYFGVTLDSLAGREGIAATQAQKMMNALRKIYSEVKRKEKIA